MALAGVGVADTGLQTNAIVEKAARKRSRSRRWAFLGILPFAAFITIFLLIPTGELIVGAFRTANGAFTFNNIRDIFQQPYPQAFEFSLEVSGLSALIGGVFGFLVANAVLHHGMPRGIRAAYVSYSGMAANFAGVPLAFAWTATLGSLGVVTGVLKHVGIHIYPGFNLQSLIGVSLVYASLVARVTFRSLAFAWTASLGSRGVVTGVLKHVGIHIYPGFNLQSLIGVSLVYAY